MFLHINYIYAYIIYVLTTQKCIYIHTLYIYAILAKENTWIFSMHNCMAISGIFSRGGVHKGSQEECLKIVNIPKSLDQTTDILLTLLPLFPPGL